MVSRFRLPAALLVSAELLSGQQAAAPARDWAIETPTWGDPQGSPSYAQVFEQEGDSTLIFHQVQWQPGWDRSDKSRPQATGLKIAYRLEGDRVRLEPFVVLGPFDENDTPRSLEGVPQESAGVYFLRFGELAVLEGMSKFGLEPLPVRLVSNKPPASAAPQIINNAPSIKVEAVDQDRTSYKLSLRNLSTKDITAVSIGATRKDGSSTMTTQGAPAIAVGALQQVIFGTVPADPAAAPSIVIDAVVFADGSFEGSPERVAEIEGDIAGRSAQRKRIAAIFRDILEGEQQDGAANIAAVRSRVNALLEKVDSAMLESVVNRFSGLPPATAASVESRIQVGLKGSRQGILRDLKEYEHKAADRRLPFRSWCEVQIKQLEAR